MPETLDPPERPETEYNSRDAPSIPEPGPSGLRVIVPAEPPQLGPAAARVLLHLLITAHENGHPAGERPQEAP
jgi:hypothetical protein